MDAAQRWFDSRPQRSMNVGFIVVHCVIPLWIGGWIYLLWRSESLLMFQWAESIGIRWFVEMGRDWFGHIGPSLPDWFLFSVPDGAWVYVATAFFGRLWRTGPLWSHVCWTSIAPALAIGGELGQIPGFIPGTFDWMDLVAYLLAAAISYWFAAIR